MKITQAIEHFNAGKLNEIEIRRNPSDNRQWFVMVTKTDGHPLMLVEENDEPVVEQDLGRLFEVLKMIGFQEARIIF